jgi:hypothetical protein
MLISNGGIMYLTKAEWKTLKMALPKILRPQIFKHFSLRANQGGVS